MNRYKLVQGQWSAGQLLVAGLWGANLLAVLVLWITTSAARFDSTYGILLSLGWLAGLLATYAALVQFLLMGRVGWIERQFGLDRLAHFHRLNGYAAITFILLHPVFIISAYSVGSGTGFWAEAAYAVRELPYVWMAAVSTVLFILVAATSVYIVRRHLRFESWYAVHLMVYAAIVLAFWHQFELGGSLNGHPLARAYWIFLYVFTAACVLYWRFTLPSLRLLRHRFQISRVVPETATSASVYICGRRLEKWHVRPGQFVLVRILAKGFWTQEHPFSVSRLPAKPGGEFRLTVRKSGDYTAQIQDIPAGAYVLVSGPFGRFTSEAATTHKRLFIAGGVGITPIRTLAEEAVVAGQDSILLYGSRSPDDVVLKQEIEDLGGQGLKTHFIYSNVDGALVARLAPDWQERDIYLCGPPPMMDRLIEDLQKMGIKPERLHYERFSLHT